MPHLTIQHSDNISREEMQRCCDVLHDAMQASRIFPLGGIRVRALSCEAFAIADRHRDNAFADMILRIGKGRSQADQKAAGEKIMAASELFFADRLKQPHFALSLEIVEIDSDLSWKVNSIHPRLKAQS